MSTNEGKSASRTKLSELLVDFIQKNRKSLIVVLICAVAVLAVVSGIVAYVDYSSKKAISVVEELSAEYGELAAVADEAARDAKTAELTEKALAASTDGMGSYAKSRAFALLGTIYADKGNWAESEKAWLSSFDTAPKSYLAPVALYNAAVAAEERGDGEKAIELYAKCADGYKETFPMASRAYFAIGRLSEAKKDFDAAKKAYKTIVDTWPSDGWSKLANSRMIAISAAEGK
jgi:tetratricopeptide (TPR) repeat protein